MAKRQHVCALCGKKLTAETSMFSRFTSNRYCSDVKACDKRRKRRRK